jgi:hypothetical protein
MEDPKSTPTETHSAPQKRPAPSLDGRTLFVLLETYSNLYQHFRLKMDENDVVYNPNSPVPVIVGLLEESHELFLSMKEQMVSEAPQKAEAPTSSLVTPCGVDVN